MTESVTESDFSKASGLFYKHESFTINDNNRVCARICFYYSFKPLL